MLVSAEHQQSAFASIGHGVAKLDLCRKVELFERSGSNPCSSSIRA
jgi:hypothetical protein